VCKLRGATSGPGQAWTGARELYVLLWDVGGSGQRGECGSVRFPKAARLKEVDDEVLEPSSRKGLWGDGMGWDVI